jgi:hypothetical protein
MSSLISMVSLLLTLLGVFAGLEPEHARNATYRWVLERGLRAGNQTVTLPRPLLHDGEGAKMQANHLRVLAGSDQAVENLLRDSVTAPFVLKVRDVRVEGAILRVADLWFVVRAELDRVDPVEAARQAEGQAAEAGNMRFESKVLSADELRAARHELPKPSDGTRAWYAHLKGLLLDRVAVEVTNLVEVSRSAHSLVIAARTAPDFGIEDRYPNLWSAASGREKSKPSSGPDVYAGGISYAKISRLASEPGALLVEAHFAFVEPQAWFHGAPILRSKFSVIAQDQIRQLRRDLARHRK